MKTLLDAIGDIIRPEFRRDGVIRLEETDPGSTCRPVKLTNRGRALVLKLDCVQRPACAQPGCQLKVTVNDRLFPLFRIDVEGVASICDYIIFHQDNTAADSPFFMFLCELKSGDPRNAKKQTQNGRLMADYIFAMAEHHGRFQLRPKRVERRGLIFSPKLPLPRIGNPRKERFPYATEDETADMKFARCRDGAEYPLTYFCA